MKVRSWLLTALLGGSVLVTSGAYSSADARAGAVRLTPQSNWALSKVDGNSASGDYCTMARRFSNNLILTMARNTGNETSLALDFQRDILTTGRAYTVILSAGDASRAFDVNPVSSKAFVIRTGQDDEIFEGVRQSGVLDVNFAGRVYRFVIGDMEEGEGQLGACVVSLVQPAAGSSIASVDGPTPLPPMPVRRVSSAADSASALPAVDSRAAERAERELERLREDIDRLDAENKRLSSALAASRRDYENRMQETDSSSVVSELREKLTLLERENMALRKSVTENQQFRNSLAGKENLVQELDQQILSLESENERLQESLKAASSYQGAASEAASLRNEIAELSSRNSKLQAELEQEKKSGQQEQLAATSSLKRAIDGLEDENERLQTSLDDTQAKLLKAKAEMAAKNSSQQQVKDLEQRLAALASEKAEREQEIAALRQQSKDTAKLESEMASLRSELDETTGRLARAQTQLVQKGGNEKLVEELESQLSVISTQKRVLENEIASLRRESQDYATLHSDMAALQSDFAKAKADNIRLRGELDDMRIAQSTGTGEEVRLSSEVARLSARIQELESENKELYKSFETARNIQPAVTADPKELAALEDRIVVLEQRLAAAQEDNNQLEGRLKIALAGNENLEQGKDVQSSMVAGLKAEIDSLRRENSSLQSELETARLTAGTEVSGELERQKTIVSDLQRQIGDLQAENIGLQASLETAREDYQSKLMAASSDGMLQAELKSLETKLEAAERANTRLNEELESIVSAGNSTSPTISSDNWDLEVATRRYSEAESEIRRLGTLLDKERAQCSAEVFELEAKLFDPIVADKAQIQKLQNLQTELKTAEQVQMSCSQRLAQLEGLMDSGTTVAALTPVPSMSSSSSEELMASALNALASAAGSSSVDTRAAVKEAGLKVPASVSTSRAVQEAASEMVIDPAVFITIEQMGDVLRQAGIVPVSGSLQSLDSVSGSGFLAFRWDTGEVYGTAEQRAMGNPGQYETLVSSYLDQAKARCPGDFAAIPSQQDSSGAANISAYEIACVGEGIDSSASLVFFASDGLFTTIAHETGTEQMDVAMDLRDSLLEQISGSMSAFRQGM